MEQLRGEQSPQMQFFTPSEYANLSKLVCRAPRPETLGLILARVAERRVCQWGCVM